MSSKKTNNIEALSERLGSLQITKEASDEYEQTTTEDISVVPVPVAIPNSKNVQTELLKNMMLDPR